jgi:hypothetical protein
MYSTKENIKKSFQLAWQYKVLWLFAALLMGGFNYSGGSNKTDTDKVRTSPLQPVLRFNNMPSDDSFQNFQNQDNFVLGTSDYTADYAPLPNPPYPQSKFARLFANTSTVPFVFIGGIFALGAVTIYAILLGLQKSWVQASLITGTFKALNNENLSLTNIKELSDSGIQNYTQVFWFNIKVFIKFILWALLLGLASMFGFVLFGPLGILVALITLPVHLVLFLNFVFTYEFGIRSLVENKLSAKEGVTSGQILNRKARGNSIKLVISHFFITVGIFLIFVIIAGVSAAAVLGINSIIGDPIVTLFISVLLLPLGLALLVCAQILSAFITTFTEISWSYLYKYESSKEVTNAGI